MSTTHIGLMRGINVGGKNRLPMADLRKLFEDAGCTDVRTYIQSGNVVFDANKTTAKRLAKAIPEAIESTLGLEVPLVIVTAKELEAALRGSPYLDRPENPKALHAMFLSRAPAASALEKLDPERSSPDEFTVRGRVIYLHCPNGMARTKLTNVYFDRTLGVTSTARNWRTLGRLHEMASGS